VVRARSSRKSLCLPGDLRRSREKRRDWCSSMEEKFPLGRKKTTTSLWGTDPGSKYDKAKNWA